MNTNDTTVTLASEFSSMEEEAERQNPGILDLLRVYGGYDDAVRQMDAYLDILHPEPHFCVSDGSGR